MGTILSVTSQTRHRGALIAPVGDFVGLTLEYRPETWSAYRTIGEVAIGVSPLRGVEWEDRWNATPRAVRLEDLPTFVDRIAALSQVSAAELAAFMRTEGNLDPAAVGNDGEALLEVETLCAEAEQVRTLRDRLYAIMDGAPESSEDWRPAEWLRQAVRRYCTLSARRAGHPRLIEPVLVAVSPFGLAYLYLAMFARSIRGEDPSGNLGRLPGRTARCANDKCGRGFWKTRRQLYCESCRESGAAAAHRKRRERARRLRPD